MSTGHDMPLTANTPFAIGELTMDNPRKIRLVIADDQPVIRQGLGYIINAQPDMTVVGEAADGQEAARMAIQSAPDIALLDIQMPGCTGIEATRMILQSAPTVRVVLLTTFDVQEYVFAGIRAGAAGYLLKDIDTGELLDSIRWAHQGHALYRTATASRAIGQMAAAGAGADGQEQPPLLEPLTEREIAVLRQMAHGRRNAEIARMLYISEGTVKTHVHRILQKMNVEDRTQAVVVAIRGGIVD